MTAAHDRARNAAVAIGDLRVIVAGGGTAGHLWPGLCTAEALVDAGVARSSIVFVGARRGPEAHMVPEAGFEVVLLDGRGIRRSLSRENIGAARGLLSAARRARAVMRDVRPHVVLGLGGYASAAVGAWAALRRVPLVLAEQNARAGAVNRLLARRAAACAVPFAETDLPRAVLTGNPVRDDFVAVRRDPSLRTEARRLLGVFDEQVLIAVVTGSLGSTRVNEAVVALAERWSHRSDVAIHHVTGRRDFPRFSDVGRTGPLRHVVVEYENDVPALYAAADVVVSRAGGGAVAELSVCGLPSVLVPLPIATQDHQRLNAQSLVEQGAAEMIPDADLDVDRLEMALRPIVDDPDRRAAMASAAFEAGRPDAATAVARLVIAAASGRTIDNVGAR